MLCALVVYICLHRMFMTHQHTAFLSKNIPWLTPCTIHCLSGGTIRRVGVPYKCNDIHGLRLFVSSTTTVRLYHFFYCLLTSQKRAILPSVLSDQGIRLIALHCLMSPSPTSFSPPLTHTTHTVLIVILHCCAAYLG